MFFGKKKQQPIQAPPQSKEERGEYWLRHLEEFGEVYDKNDIPACINAYLAQVDEGMSFEVDIATYIFRYRGWPVVSFKWGEIRPCKAPFKQSVYEKEELEGLLSTAEQSVREAKEALVLFATDPTIAEKAQSALEAESQRAEELRAAIASMDAVSEEALAAKATEWLARLRFQYGYTEERRRKHYPND